jgi:hypothetical protein
MLSMNFHSVELQSRFQLRQGALIKRDLKIAPRTHPLSSRFTSCTHRPRTWVRTSTLEATAGSQKQKRRRKKGPTHKGNGV